MQWRILQILTLSLAALVTVGMETVYETVQAIQLSICVDCTYLYKKGILIVSGGIEKCVQQQLIAVIISILGEI